MHGGVLVAIKKTNFAHLEDRYIHEGPQSEHLMIELCPANRSKFLLGVLYRPPNSEDDLLRDSLERLYRRRVMSICSGRRFQSTKC